MMLRENIGWKNVWYYRNGMIMVVARGGEALEGLENNLMA
jgi:hypothetical protein